VGIAEGTNVSSKRKTKEKVGRKKENAKPG
jgi:hypothetical protein